MSLVIETLGMVAATLTTVAYLPQSLRTIRTRSTGDFSLKMLVLLTAGLILGEFVGDVPWAHLDIAGPARSDADEGYTHKGATGFGVRTLIELASQFAAPRREAPAHR